MSSLISSLAWYPLTFVVSFRSIDSKLINRVKRGVAQQNPQKYILDDQELQRVSSLARIELEDAKTELQRAQRAADAVLTRAASGIDEDAKDDSAWVE